MTFPDPRLDTIFKYWYSLSNFTLESGKGTYSIFPGKD